jgi:hypothetical protein
LLIVSNTQRVSYQSGKAPIPINWFVYEAAFDDLSKELSYISTNKEQNVVQPKNIEVAIIVNEVITLC